MATDAKSTDTTTTTTTTTSSTSSKLLIWPRQRRRHHPRSNKQQRQQSGFVLGWTTPSSSSTTSSSSSSHRQSVVCIGILPNNNNKSLEDYQNHLTKLRDVVMESSKPKLCSCLIDSLEIVAYYASNKEDENNNNNAAIQSSSSSTSTSSGGKKLPVISLRNGYPWWTEDNLPNESDKEDGTNKKKNNNINNTTKIPSNTNMHRQIVYYHQEKDDVDKDDNDDDNKNHNNLDYTHWSSDSSNIDENWKRLLHQMSHAREIFDMVKTGQTATIDDNGHYNIYYFLDQPPRPVGGNDASKSADKDSNDDKEAPSSSSSSSSSLWKRIQEFVLMQSLTLLHFQQRFHAKEGENASIMTMIPLFHTLHLYYYQTMSSSPKAEDYICPCCDKPSLLVTKPLAAKRVVTEWDHLLTAAFDALFGVGTAICLLLLLRYAPPIVGTTLIDVKTTLLQVLQDYIAWLETFPAGFKLNVKLTANMGHEIQNLIGLHQQWMEATLWNAQVWRNWLGPGLALLSAIGGWNAFLAVVVDMMRLECWHVTALLFAFRTIYRAELYLLGAFGRLFRGKKRNVLRQRTDSMEYDAMQLLVGTIGFSICIFLWTTIMVYYSFFVIWNILLHLPVIVVWVMYVLSRSMPWGSLMWRILKGGWFTDNVYIQTQNDGEIMHVSWMFPIAKSPVGIVGSRVFVHLKPLLKWLVNFCLEILLPRASNESPCTMPFVTFIRGFQKSYNERS